MADLIVSSYLQKVKEIANRQNLAV